MFVFDKDATKVRIISHIPKEKGIKFVLKLILQSRCSIM